MAYGLGLRRSCVPCLYLVAIPERLGEERSMPRGIALDGKKRPGRLTCGQA